MHAWWAERMVMNTGATRTIHPRTRFRNEARRYVALILCVGEVSQRLKTAAQG